MYWLPVFTVCEGRWIINASTILEPVTEETPSTDAIGTFQVIPERHALGANLIGSGDDLNLCLNQCQQPTCFAVDFDFEDNTCWHHNDVTSCAKLFVKKDCTHFRMSPCGELYKIVGPKAQQIALNKIIMILEAYMAINFNILKALLQYCRWGTGAPRYKLTNI